ncbi:hypothetical protein Bbelb_057990 [Branchiostoma belcheri]|nr:hypothetical protein Bbelb_057990 [Branchiostoma belcheri]
MGSCHNHLINHLVRFAHTVQKFRTGLGCFEEAFFPTITSPKTKTSGDFRRTENPPQRPAGTSQYLTISGKQPSKSCRGLGTGPGCLGRQTGDKAGTTPSLSGLFRARFKRDLGQKRLDLPSRFLLECHIPTWRGRKGGKCGENPSVAGISLGD